MRFFRKLRKRLPKKNELENQAGLGMFRNFWARSELWALNRSSLSKGIAAGIFCAFLPMPFEVIVAAFLAIMLGGNIIFATTLIWISNPVTWIPLYTPCYLLGAKILHLTPISLDAFHSLNNITHLGYHYAALWTGCLIVGITLSISAYFIISFMWRFKVRSEWQTRKDSRLIKAKKENVS